MEATLGSVGLVHDGAITADGDKARVIALLKRVAEEADRLEQIHLPGADRGLDLFVEDLRKEGMGFRD